MHKIYSLFCFSEACSFCSPCLTHLQKQPVIEILLRELLKPEIKYVISIVIIHLITVKLIKRGQLVIIAFSKHSLQLGLSALQGHNIQHEIRLISQKELRSNRELTCYFFSSCERLIHGLSGWSRGIGKEEKSTKEKEKLHTKYGCGDVLFLDSSCLILPRTKIEIDPSLFA